MRYNDIIYIYINISDYKDTNIGLTPDCTYYSGYQNQYFLRNLYRAMLEPGTDVRLSTTPLSSQFLQWILNQIWLLIQLYSTHSHYYV